MGGISFFLPKNTIILNSAGINHIVKWCEETRRVMLRLATGLFLI